MAARSSSHARSISLPSTSHPLNAATEDHLSRLQQGFDSESSSSSSIFSNLAGIKDVYERINDLILLPLNQNILSREIHRSGVEMVLEGSLALLDICGTAIDAVSQMKESIQDLESSLRRRNGEASALSAYKTSRRRIIKSVANCLGNLKKVNKAPLEKNEKLTSVVRMLKEAEIICLSTLKSLLVFVSGSKARHGWSLVAKLMQPKLNVSSDSEVEANEVEMIDQALSGLDAKKFSSDVRAVQNLQKQLGALEMFINDIEDGVESVSRTLVKTRVSLLNVINH